MNLTERPTFLQNLFISAVAQFKMRFLKDRLVINLSLKATPNSFRRTTAFGASARALYFRKPLKDLKVLGYRWFKAVHKLEFWPHVDKTFRLTKIKRLEHVVNMHKIFVLKNFRQEPTSLETDRLVAW